MVTVDNATELMLMRSPVTVALVAEIADLIHEKGTATKANG
jgi:hypothetical protein